MCDIVYDVHHKERSGEMNSQCLCTGIFEDEYPEEESKVKLWMAGSFSAKLGETLLLPGRDRPILLGGLGSRKDATPTTVRLAAVAVGRRLRHLDTAICDLGEVNIPGQRPELIRQAAAEGVHLGSYSFVTFGERWRVTNQVMWH
jgi:hypothetical protein